SAAPDESVVMSRRAVWIAPEVWPPGQPGRFDRSSGGIIVEVWRGIDLIFNQPLHAPGGIMIERFDWTANEFGVLCCRCGHVHRCFRRAVDDLDVGITGVNRVNDLLPRMVRLLSICREKP